jgi:triacylglycerol esterase/lipase EstA (alpha/beta hydrolase family)
LVLKPEEQQLREAGVKLQYSEKHMLVVMCHGYQGSSYDMGLIKRWVQIQLPDAYYLIARSNEGDTDGDIKVMGKNLAEEIDKYIETYMEEYEQENVIINLVGHSMGGIIARSALPHLVKYRYQMGFFLSLSSPHLGYLNGVSGIIKVGLWAIRKFKNIVSLSQLSM